MRYSGEIIKLEGLKTMQRTAKKARSEFLEGKTIFLHPCLMTLQNPWQRPMALKLDQYLDFESDEFAVKEFKRMVNEFTHYSCNQELGTYPIFFVEL